MNDADRYFLPEVASDLDLAAWADILPTAPRVLRMTLFADVILAADDGSVHLLDVAASNCSKIAGSEGDFWDRIDRDEEGWQLRQLADKCRLAGKIVDSGQCYAFSQMPVFGGKYEPDNIWVCSLAEWLTLTADIFQQTRALPDGTVVDLRLDE